MHTLPSRLQSCFDAGRRVFVYMRGSGPNVDAVPNTEAVRSDGVQLTAVHVGDAARGNREE